MIRKKVLFEVPALAIEYLDSDREDESTTIYFNSMEEAEELENLIDIHEGFLDVYSFEEDIREDDMESILLDTIETAKQKEIIKKLLKVKII